MGTSIIYNKACVSVRDAASIPKTEHWAIIESDTMFTTSGYDEDPGKNAPILRYYAFTDKNAWREQVTKLFREKPDRTDVRAVHVIPVNPEVDVKIDVKF